MLIFPLTNASDSVAVSGTAAAMGGPGATAMLSGQLYLFLSTTNCWIRQGTATLITPVAKANLLDSDFITISAPGSKVVYEFDVTGNGVTTGRVQVNVSTDTTAAQVGTRLATAIATAQPTLEITDNTGTVTVVAPNMLMTSTENVVDAGFTLAATAMTVTAADKSMLVPLGLPGVLIQGINGPQLAVIQDTAAGKASLTRCKTN